MAELQTALDAFFASFERGDGDALAAALASDAQGVDEISRRWIRGTDEVRTYVRGLVSMVAGVKTKFSDSTEIIDGDTGVLTCWMEQDYTVEGAMQHVSAPTTVLFKRESSGWKISLFHSVPMPPEEA
jgi:ketosteroid isomerase-like protein